MIFAIDKAQFLTALHQCQCMVAQLLAPLSATSNSNSLKLLLLLFEGQVALIAQQYDIEDNHAQTDTHDHNGDTIEQADYFFPMCYLFLFTQYILDALDAKCKQSPYMSEVRRALLEWHGEQRWKILYPCINHGLNQIEKPEHFEIDLRDYVDGQARLPHNFKIYLIELLANIRSIQADLDIVKRAPDTCNPSQDKRLATNLETIIPKTAYYLADYAYQSLIDIAPALADHIATQNTTPLNERDDINELRHGDILKHRIIITTVLQIVAFTIEYQRTKTYSEGDAYLLEHPEKSGTFSGFIACGILLLAQIDPNKAAERKKRIHWKNDATTAEKALNMIIESRVKSVYSDFAAITLAEITRVIRAKNNKADDNSLSRHQQKAPY